jgi:D-cysteine desulfhydrase family pyridoxal phosphate-dependent enzyme
MSPLARFPRVSLGHFPTPLEPLERLRAALGPRCPALWVKRDDCSGLATGGNKTRKLEYLLGEARARGAGAVVTFGALQSNHARQTAAAAAKLGLACDLVLIEMVERADEAYRRGGNVQLDRLLGARVHVTTPERVGDALAEITRAHGRLGREVYVVPVGGSNAIGSLGYVNAFDELAAQARALGLAVDAIVHATSSGGTQAGLVAGALLAGSATRILGVNVYKPSAAEIASHVEELARETLALLGGDAAGVAARLHVIDGWLGAGYGQPTAAMREALALAARSEGLLFDPVYSGKALAALVGAVRGGELDPNETVVFWHTGGTASLGAYADAV